MKVHLTYFFLILFFLYLIFFVFFNCMFLSLPLPPFFFLMICFTFPSPPLILFIFMICFTSPLTLTIQSVIYATQYLHCNPFSILSYPILLSCFRKGFVMFILVLPFFNYIMLDKHFLLIFFWKILDFENSLTLTWHDGRKK